MLYILAIPCGFAHNQSIETNNTGANEMSKEFTKGQVVIRFASLDHKGTWGFTRAIVGSCGAKQMTLSIQATGQLMGRTFEPNSKTTYVNTFQGVTYIRNHTGFTMADMSDEEAHAVCIKHAELQLATERAHFASRIAEHADDAGYVAAIKKLEAQLHEAQSIKRA